MEEVIKDNNVALWALLALQMLAAIGFAFGAVIMRTIWHEIMRARDKLHQQANVLQRVMTTVENVQKEVERLERRIEQQK